MAQATFDLVVIGSGPAGQKAALNAAKVGKRVALIDRKELVGGVCIHCDEPLLVDELLDDQSATLLS